MKFRKEEVDDVLIIESESSLDFSKQILELGDKYIVIDVQYNIRVIHNLTIYSALVLVRIK